MGKTFSTLHNKNHFKEKPKMNTKYPKYNNYNKGVYCDAIIIF